MGEGTRPQGRVWAKAQSGESADQRQEMESDKVGD